MRAEASGRRTISLLIALTLCAAPRAVFSQDDDPFAEFPGLPCEMYEEMAPDGLSDDDLHPIGIWLHGFLSGAAWSAPDFVTADGGRNVDNFREIERDVAALCTANPSATITSDVLRSFYVNVN